MVERDWGLVHEHEVDLRMRNALRLDRIFHCRLPQKRYRTTDPVDFSRPDRKSFKAP